MATGHLWLHLLCALAAIHTACSIRCWECNSHYDRNCADPFQNETFELTNCDQRDLDHMPNQKATVCRKIVQKVRDDYRFVRGCGWLSNEKEGMECFKRAGTFNVLIQYCGCGQDGCNSSPHTRLLSTAAALLVIVAALIWSHTRRERKKRLSLLEAGLTSKTFCCRLSNQKFNFILLASLFDSNFPTVNQLTGTTKANKIPSEHLGNTGRGKKNVARLPSYQDDFLQIRTFSPCQVKRIEFSRLARYITSCGDSVFPNVSSVF